MYPNPCAINVAETILQTASTADVTPPNQSGWMQMTQDRSFYPAHSVERRYSGLVSAWRSNISDNWATQCGIKRSFGDEKSANEFMLEKGILHLKAYKCTKCGLFHLGHPPGTKKEYLTY